MSIRNGLLKEILIATGGGGGGSLTEVQSKTLEYFHYDAASNTLIADRTISTEPATIEIGNHTLSSANENFIFTNLETKIDWFPSWQGIKDQSEIVNQDETGIIPPSFRHYTSNLLDLFPNGAVPDASIVVGYEVDALVGDNVSIHSQEVVLGEAIAADDWLVYTQVLPNSGGRQTYKQTLTGITLNVGDTLVWFFDHPIEIRANTQAYAAMQIHKGSQDATSTVLQVRAGADTSQRYIKVGYRSFADEDVMSGVLYTTASQTIRYAATYAVDTSAGQVDLAVNADVGYKSFVVFDANQNFNTNSCVVDFGGTQGTATLQTKNDSFLFYYTGVEWRYLDLNTKNGGVV